DEKTFLLTFPPPFCSTADLCIFLLYWKNHLRRESNPYFYLRIQTFLKQLYLLYLLVQALESNRHLLFLPADHLPKPSVKSLCRTPYRLDDRVYTNQKNASEFQHFLPILCRQF